MKTWVSFFMISALLVIGDVQAGAGHDHGHDVPEGNTVNQENDKAPRLVMSSEQFELVGLIEGLHMHLYLDYFSTNDPVKNALIELEITGESIKAENEGNGTYHITLRQTLEEGSHPVLVTIITETTSDLLVGVLDIDAVEEVHEEEYQGIVITPLQLFLIVSTIVLFFFVLVLAMRRDVSHRGTAS